MKIIQTSEALGARLRPGEDEGRPGSTPLRAQPESVARPETDQVRLSPEGQRFAAATSERREIEDRAEKIEEVRRAIREGRFQVSAQVVAERMIGEAAELIESLARLGKH